MAKPGSINLSPQDLHSESLLPLPLSIYEGLGSLLAVKWPLYPRYGECQPNLPKFFGLVRTKWLGKEEGCSGEGCSREGCSGASSS